MPFSPDVSANVYSLHALPLSQAVRHEYRSRAIVTRRRVARMTSRTESLCACLKLTGDRAYRLSSKETSSAQTNCVRAVTLSMNW
jgi:hypothetical protein